MIKKNKNLINLPVLHSQLQLLFGGGLRGVSITALVLNEDGSNGSLINHFFECAPPTKKSES